MFIKSLADDTKLSHAIFVETLNKLPSNMIAGTSFGEVFGVS